MKWLSSILEQLYHFKVPKRCMEIGEKCPQLYHFKVPKRCMEIGEKCPQFHRFEVEKRPCRRLSFVLSASRVCGLKTFLWIFKFASEIKSYVKKHTRMANFSVQNGEKLLNENKISKLTNKVLEKRQLRESVPDFKTKALAIRTFEGKEKCENEHRENEPFSTAERSERVENFLFCATREYTEAGIEQATVAMRCLGASSPEPRRRAVPRSDMSALRIAAGLEKSGRIVAFCDWNARFCDQKTWCSRNFAPKTRRPGASLRPDEHSSRPDSENRNQKRLSFPTRTKESDVSLASSVACACRLGVDRKLSTCAAICTAGFVVWHLAICG